MMKNPSLYDLDSSGKRDCNPRVFLALSATYYKFGVNLGFSWPEMSLSSDACTSVIRTQPDTTSAEEYALQGFKPDQTLLGLRALWGFKPDQTRLY